MHKNLLAVRMRICWLDFTFCVELSPTTKCVYVEIGTQQVSTSTHFASAGSMHMFWNMVPNEVLHSLIIPFQAHTCILLLILFHRGEYQARRRPKYLSKAARFGRVVVPTAIVPRVFMEAYYSLLTLIVSRQLVVVEKAAS